MDCTRLHTCTVTTDTTESLSDSWHEKYILKEYTIHNWTKTKNKVAPLKRHNNDHSFTHMEVQKWHLRQNGSLVVLSSLLSRQSFLPSHVQALVMQRLFRRHLNWSAKGHFLGARRNRKNTNLHNKNIYTPTVQSKTLTTRQKPQIFDCSKRQYIIWRASQRFSKNHYFPTVYWRTSTFFRYPFGRQVPLFKSRICYFTSLQTHWFGVSLTDWGCLWRAVEKLFIAPQRNSNPKGLQLINALLSLQKDGTCQ